MDTGKTATLIMSLIVGVILIAGVMTPILQSVIGDSGGNDDSSDDSANTGGFSMRDFATTVDTYGLTEFISTDDGYTRKTITMRPVSDELHWQLVTTYYNDEYDVLSENVEMDVVMENCVIFVGGYHLYAYIDGNVICDGDYDGSQTLPEVIPLSELGSVLITTWDGGYGLEITDSNGSTIANASSPVMVEATTTLVADPNGTHMGYAGNDTPFYFSDDIICGYIADKNMITYISDTDNYGIIDDPTEYYTYINPYDITLVNPFEDDTSEYHHIEGTSAETNLSINYHYYIYDDNEGDIDTEDTQICNVYVIPIDPDAPGNSPGGNSGNDIDGSLASMISLIPLLMTVGLVIATVSIWKRQ